MNKSKKNNKSNNKIKNKNNIKWFNKKYFEYKNEIEEQILPLRDELLAQKILYVYSDVSYVKSIYGNKASNFLSTLTNKMTISHKIRELIKILKLLLKIFYLKNNKKIKSLPLTYSGAVVITLLYKDIFYEELEKAFLNIYKFKNINLIFDEYNKEEDKPISKYKEDELINNYIDFRLLCKKFIITIMKLDEKKFNNFLKGKNIN